MKTIAASLFLLGLISPCYAQTEATWLINENVLGCSPGSLSSTGVLTLHLGPGHGKELAIRRVSDKAWFFLVVESPPPNTKTLMSAQSYSIATRVRIPATYRAIEWVNGTHEEPVFSTSGIYEVYTSDNLESEAGGAKCTIRYRAPGP